MKQPEEIRDIAQKHQINTTGLSKIALIRKIQQSEGCSDCFATARNGECDKSDCSWRNDCFATCGYSR